MWERVYHWVPSHSRVCYSQFGEDAILDWLTRECEPGFYVDIGAFHPVYLSNTYALYLRGWRGIAIEARPEMRNEFELFRPRDITVSCCVGPEDREEATLVVFEDVVHTTLDPALAARSVAAGEKVRERITVPVLGINSALSRWKPEGVRVDLLSIDVEGLDEAILQAYDFEKYAPRLLVFERHGTNVEDLASLPIVQFLKSQGYSLVTLCGPSVIMRRVASASDCPC